MPSFIWPALKPDSTQRAQIGLWRCHLGLALIMTPVALQVGWIKHTRCPSLQLPEPAIPTPASTSSLQTSLCASAVLAELLCLEHDALLRHQALEHAQIPFSGMRLPSNTFQNKCYASFGSGQVIFPQQSDFWPPEKLSVYIFHMCLFIALKWRLFASLVSISWVGHPPPDYKLPVSSTYLVL